MNKSLITLTTTAFLGLSLLTVQAQSAVDPALLDTVTQAITNTQAVSSLRIESQSQTEIAGLPAGMSFGQQGTEVFDLVKTETGWNAAGSRTTAMTSPMGEMTSTSETIILEDVIYLNLGEMPEQMAEGLPEGWFDVAALGEQAGAAQAFVANDATLLGALGFPVNTESVLTLSELPGDTIEGQAMRVFQLTLDPTVVIESEAVGLLNAGGGFMGGGMPGNFTPPADAPAIAPEDIEPPNPEDFEITFAVYVGADDGLVHRIYSVIATQMDMQGQTMGLNLTTITNYSQFNVPVEIVAPEIVPAS